MGFHDKSMGYTKVKSPASKVGLFTLVLRDEGLTRGVENALGAFDNWSN
jgi:hypothetical protein